MMKKFLFTSIVTLLSTIYTYAQKAPDFNVTDVNGNKHALYNDYLNKGKIVVLQLFFTECIPCNALAANQQVLNLKYGDGKERVQFMNLSIQALDSVAGVREYAMRHGLTFPHISPQGGSLSTTLPYLNNTFGVFQGTPVNVIIKPNGSLEYDVVPFRLEERIDEALKSTLTLPNRYNVVYDIQSTIKSIPDGSKFVLRSKKDINYNKAIQISPTGVVSFDYPSNIYPETEQPYLEFNTSAITPKSLINITDIVALRKHVLRIDTLDELALIAADISNDGKVNIVDIVDMQKFILRIYEKWPSREAVVMHPATIDLDTTGSGRTTNLRPTLVWIGDLVR